MSGKLSLMTCQWSVVEVASSTGASQGQVPFNEVMKDIIEFKEREWIQHFNTTWLLVKQCGDLFHYKSLQEYFDRQQLSAITDVICSKLAVTVQGEMRHISDQLSFVLLFVYLSCLVKMCC
jgi:hypothetical protein